MRWTQYLIPTTKETPKDAVVPSHQLMLRAGLIRQLAAGIYTYLPLGYRALRKVEAIVREEMNRAGAVELYMPVLHPIDLWRQTGRTEAMGDTLLRLAGPADDWRSQTVLGPTHEEPITELARAYLTSYRQLPINLYQIQVKFRGEARPKSGVLRTREFLMKDAYGFHDSKESLDEGYRKMYAAYCRIFARCGLPYVVVEAESGPIGGDASHEFMVRTDAGEDVLVRCRSCRYAANTERAEPAPLPQNESPMQPVVEVHTPSQRTIDEVTAFLGTTPQQMIKTLVYTEKAKPNDAEPAGPHGAPAAPSHSLWHRLPACVSTAETPVPHAAPSHSLWHGRLARDPTAETAVPHGAGHRPPPVVVLVRGDHEVNENKLNRLAGATLELADEDTIERLTSAKVGFAGPHALDRSGVPYRLIIDQAVAVMRNAATGACKTDYHVTGVNPGRDFPLSSANVLVGDVRTVAAQDHCPRCGGGLDFDKCIEVGHVFKLGTKYSDALGATYTDKDGKAKPLIMGCYGIGLNRILAAAIEASHDADGIIWPASIAPFHVLVLALDPRNDEVMATAGRLHDELEAAGLDVLFDDRDERAGFKFKDADLIGIPVRITVGHKSLTQGVVELKLRGKPDIERLAPADAVRRADQIVKKAVAELDAHAAAAAR